MAQLGPTDPTIPITVERLSDLIQMSHEREAYLRALRTISRLLSTPLEEEPLRMALRAVLEVALAPEDRPHVGGAP
jgi:hypothetical protein